MERFSFQYDLNSTYSYIITGMYGLGSTESAEQTNEYERSSGQSEKG